MSEKVDEYVPQLGDVVRVKGETATWKIVGKKEVLVLSGPGPCRSLDHAFPEGVELVRRGRRSKSDE